MADGRWLMADPDLTKRVAPRALCLALALCLLAIPASAETIDRALAVVAGQLILLSDVTAASQLGLVLPDPTADPIGSVLAKLVDRELVLAEVERYAPPEPTAEAVDREIAAVRARFPSDQAFEATLTKTGYDVAHLRETLRQNLRIRAYLDQRFTIAGREEQRQALVDDWIAGLRRRADVINLYLPGR